MPAAPHARRTRGFSLVELLVALSLGAVLISSLATATQLFGENVETARSGPQKDLEETLNLVTDTVRKGWSAAQLSATDMAVYDSYGNRTRFYLYDDEFRIERPNGAVGTLIGDVREVHFHTKTMRRFRDIAPIDSYGSFWSRSVATASFGLAIWQDRSLAMGFTVSSHAPSSVETVPGITEQLIEAEPDYIILPLAYIDGSPTEHCHRHGSRDDPPHAHGESMLRVELYDARAPDDARPYGPMIAATSIPTDSLPPASYRWVDSATNEPVTPPEVLNPHGGVDWDWWDANPQVDLVVDAPTVNIPLAISDFDRTVEPGRAYTLVFAVTNFDLVAVRAGPQSASVFGGAARTTTPGGPLVPQDLVIECDMTGRRQYSQTEAHDVVSRVTTTLKLFDTRTLSSSAVVTTQTSVDNPWFGAVPSEVPTLEMDGM